MKCLRKEFEFLDLWYLLNGHSVILLAELITGNLTPNQIAALEQCWTVWGTVIPSYRPGTNDGLPSHPKQKWKSQPQTAVSVLLLLLVHCFALYTYTVGFYINMSVWQMILDCVYLYKRTCYNVCRRRWDGELRKWMCHSGWWSIPEGATTVQARSCNKRGALCIKVHMCTTFSGHSNLK